MPNMPIIESGQNMSSSSQPVWSRSETPNASTVVEAIASRTSTASTRRNDAGDAAGAQGLRAVEGADQEEQADLEEAGAQAEHDELDGVALGRAVGAAQDDHDSAQAAAPMLSMCAVEAVGAVRRWRRGRGGPDVGAGGGGGLLDGHEVLLGDWAPRVGADDRELSGADRPGRQGAASLSGSRSRPGRCPGHAGPPDPGGRDVGRADNGAVTAPDRLPGPAPCRPVSALAVSLGADRAWSCGSSRSGSTC